MTSPSGDPPIAEPLLRERLAMDDEAFAVFMAETRRSVPPRAFTPEAWATALGYPWERPARSFLLDGERVVLLDELEPARRGALLAGRGVGEDGTARYPLLAFGSNGAPMTLQRKLAHLEPAAERRVLVLAGELRGFDVGASAHPTGYGSMAASLFESPGTAVRAAVLMVSAAQLTQLCWTEVSYRLGRLDAAFAADDEGVVTDHVLAFAARLGTFCPDGEPLALAAIPATGRTARALTQEQLLSQAARVMLGDGAGAETLVRRIFEDLAGLPPEASARIQATGRPFAPPGWTPLTPS